MDSKKQFELEVANALAKTFTDAAKSKSKKPSGYIASLYGRYSEAFAQGAIFYGPIACFPPKEERRRNYWTIVDMRGGWGYSPLNLDIYVEEGEPTLEGVVKALKGHYHTFQMRAYDCENVVELLTASMPKE